MIDGYNKACEVLSDIGVELNKKEYIYNEDINVSKFFTPKEIIQKSNVFVDLQNDVTTKDIATAIGDGYKSIEHVKRYTAMGFGTDQGKTGNINGMAVVSHLLNE